MKVLVDAVAAFSGAGPTHVRELAATFPSLGPESSFLFVVHPSLEPLVQRIAPTIETVSPPVGWSRPPGRLAWEHLWVPRIAARWDADIVYAPFNVLPLKWPQARPRLAVLLTNLAPYAEGILSNVGMGSRFRFRILRSLTDRSISVADRVFILSSQARDLVGTRLTPDKTRSLTVSAPPGTVASAGTISIPQEPFFLVAGDLLPHKGADMVVRALKYIRPPSRPLVLLCGRPLHRSYVKRLLRLIDETGVGGRVRLLGWLEDYSDVMGLMRSSVACILPSRFENMSLVPFEAMAVGTAVIASRIPVFVESCGDAALYFGVDDPVELARQMQRLLEQNQERTKLREEGIRRIEARGPSLAEQIWYSLIALQEGPHP